MKKRESDLCKALVLYQPAGNIRNFARNLASTTDNLDSKKTTSTERSKFYTVFFICGILIVTASFICRNSQDGCLPDSPQINFTVVAKELNRFLYGQNMAVNILVENLRHVSVTVENIHVFLLYGGTGTGKTWTLHLLSRSLPVNVKQIFLHLESLSDEEISDRIADIKCCEWNFLFIEDTDYADYRKIERMIRVLNEVARESASVCPDLKIIVMLTSSVGQRALTKILFDQFQNNGSRDSVNLSRLNEIDSPLITALNENYIHFVSVPYLPLGKEEIKSCILEDCRLKKKVTSATVIGQIMRSVRFFPATQEYFSVTGCKTVSTKVNLYS